MALKPITVSQLNDYISRIISTDPLLSNISIKGEISNLKYHSSGHVYFSMIDEGSKVNCFLPASYIKNIDCRLCDGLSVTVCGYLNVYKKGGTYTLFIRTLEAEGEGSLSAAFEILKNKLSREGLFDPEHKKPIPKFPKRIGILTSETGAAVRDIIKIITSRTVLTDVTVFPVQVQGQGAAENIAQTIDMINKEFACMDLLIVGRGGGSSEDLQAFNEEILARAIYRSQIPVISAVGHETDFSICDFTADMRAETPTAAAEMAVPDDRLLKERIEALASQMTSHLKNRLEYSELLAQRYKSDMHNMLLRKTEELRHAAEKHLLTLEENRPSRVLEKGYSIIQGSGGKTVTSVKDIEADTAYNIILKDGSVLVTISSVKREDEEN